MAQQTAKPQPGQLGDARDELGGAAPLGIDAAAMEADVDFDQHVDFALIDPHQPRPAARHVEIVDDEGEPRGDRAA